MLKLAHAQTFCRGVGLTNGREWQSGKLGTGSRVQSFPRAFPSSTDVTVVLLNQPNKTAGMLVFQTNPVVVEPFSNVKAFFCCNESTQLLVTLVKTFSIFFFLHNLTLRYTKELSCRYPIHIRPYLSMLEIHFIVRDPGSRDRCPQGLVILKSSINYQIYIYFRGSQISKEVETESLIYFVRKT